jgi:uncharacterized membrane protein YbhN (UPF0104 family)
MSPHGVRAGDPVGPTVDPVTTSGYRTTFTLVTRILAMATGTLAVIQFALAGYGAFGSLQHEKDWGAHEKLGGIIIGFALLTLIAALVARPGRRWIIASAVLFVLCLAQMFLADAGKNHAPAWGAVHALSGVAIIAMCGLASRKVPPVSTP